MDAHCCIEKNNQKGWSLGNTDTRKACICVYVVHNQTVSFHCMSVIQFKLKASMTDIVVDDTNRLLFCLCMEICRRQRCRYVTATASILMGLLTTPDTYFPSCFCSYSDKVSNMYFLARSDENQDDGSNQSDRVLNWRQNNCSSENFSERQTNGFNLVSFRITKRWRRCDI